MKKIIFFIVIGYIICGVLSSLASADELYLKNGRMISGIVLKQTSGGVTIKLKIGEITYPASQVDKVIMASAEENEAIKSQWQAQKEAKKAEDAEEDPFAIFEDSEIDTPAAEVEVSGKMYTKGDRIYLNDELFFIKGIAYGINYPGCLGGMGGYYRIPPDVFEKDFQMMQEAGINCIRSYEPLPPEILDLADKYDIMVIENIVYPGDWTNFKSDDELKALQAEALRIVKRDKDRKCILMWSIWNDAPFTWGKHGGNVVKRYGFDEVNDFLKEIYNAVKKEDPEHLITASNMLGHIGTEVGFNFLDVIGLNAYIGGHGQWLGVAKAKEAVDKIQNIAVDYDKPVIIMETGYSTYINEELQYEVLKTQIEITDEHTAGIIIFQWSDGWWKAGEPSVLDDHIEEHWGIVTGYRDPKPGYKAISELFNQIPTNSRGFFKEE
jgi:hypothetical protein